MVASTVTIEVGRQEKGMDIRQDAVYSCRALLELSENPDYQRYDYVQICFAIGC